MTQVHWKCSYELMRKFLATTSLFIFILSFVTADIFQESSEEIAPGQGVFSRSDIPNSDHSENMLHITDAGEEESRCRVRSRIIFQTTVAVSDRTPVRLIKSTFIENTGKSFKSRVCTQLQNQRAPPVEILL